MTKSIFILLGLFCAINVSAQSITGKVVDSSNQPVPYVSCILHSMPDSTFVLGVLTDSEGNFEIPVQEAASYIIRISYLGYKSIEMECSQGDLGMIVLEEDALALQEIVVKGERPLVSMVNNRLSYNIDVILDQKIISNAHELIKELPSVISFDGNSLDVVGSTSTTIRIAGRSSQLNTEQLIDYLKSLPAEEVERIEIILNPPPQWHVKEGSVINVVMKKKRNYSVSGQVQGTWTNQYKNSYDLGGTVIASTPKWNLDLMYKFADKQNITKEESEGIHTVNGTSYDISSIVEGLSKLNRHSIYTNIGYKINDNNTLSLSYNAVLTPKNISESYSQNNMFSDANSVNSGNNNLHNVTLSYISEKGVSAGVEYTNYTDAATQNMETLNADTFQESFSYSRKQSIDRVKAYLDMSSRLKNDWTLNYGANYNYVSNRNEQENVDIQNNGANDYSLASEVNEYTAIAYIGFEKAFFDGRLSANASLSGELYKINDYENNALLPNGGLTYFLSYKHIFQLSYNSVRTYPTYWERQDYTSYTDEYTVYMGNPLLRPARTSYVDLNYILNSKYIFQVSYYHVNDFFFYQSYQMPDELTLLYKAFNIEYTSSLNFTAVIPVSIGKWLSSNLIFVGYNERYKSDDWYGYQYDRNKWAGMVAANNTVNISQKPKISANCLLFYRTPTIQGIWDLSSNWGANLGIRYSFLNDNAILSLQCNDLFESIDPKILVRFYTQNQTVSENAYQRNIILRFTYKFKGYTSKEPKEIDTSRFGI